MNDRGNGTFRLGYGRLSIEATGRDVVLFIILLAASGVIVWSNLLVAERVNQQNVAAIGATIERVGHDRELEHDAIRAALDAGAQATTRLGCLLSLEVEDRITALRSGDPCVYALHGFDKRKGPR